MPASALPGLPQARICMSLPDRFTIGGNAGCRCRNASVSHAPCLGHNAFLGNG